MIKRLVKNGIKKYLDFLKNRQRETRKIIIDWAGEVKTACQRNGDREKIIVTNKYFFMDFVDDDENRYTDKIINNRLGTKIRFELRMGRWI